MVRSVRGFLSSKPLPTRQNDTALDSIEQREGNEQRMARQAKQIHCTTAAEKIAAARLSADNSSNTQRMDTGLLIQACQTNTLDMLLLTWVKMLVVVSSSSSLMAEEV